MKKSLLILAVIVCILSSCNLPRQAGTPAPQDVETQVVQLLTSIPTITKLPTATKSASTASPTQTTAVPSQTAAVPTGTPTVRVATATNIPIPTSLPSTATISPADPRTTLGQPTRKDDMSDGGSFFTYTDEHVSFDPEDNGILMTAYKTDSWHGWSLSGITLKDAYIEMTAKPGSCSGKDRYGLVLRSPDPTQAYFYGFSCDGRYSLRKWDGSEFTIIVDWASSSSILSGAEQTNRLGVKMVGSHFTFYANGNQIGEADDSSFKEGKLGIFIAASATENFSVLVDEVDYWILQ